MLRTSNLSLSTLGVVMGISRADRENSGAEPGQPEHRVHPDDARPLLYPRLDARMRWQVMGRFTSRGPIHQRSSPVATFLTDAATQVQLSTCVARDRLTSRHSWLVRPAMRLPYPRLGNGARRLQDAVIATKQWDRQ